jgi:hypothetical protein
MKWHVYVHFELGMSPLQNGKEFLKVFHVFGWHLFAICGGRLRKRSSPRDTLLRNCDFMVIIVVYIGDESM